MLKILSLALLITSCASLNLPKFERPIYVGDSKQGGLVRSQAGEYIDAHSDDFQGVIAMKPDDFYCFNQTYTFNCKEWVNPAPVCKPLDASTLKIAMEYLKKHKVKE